MTFEQCYAENYEVVRAFIYRRVRNDADAEDLAQEVFLIFHRKMAEVGNPAAFLYAVARNKVIDFFRSKHARRECGGGGFESLVDTSAGVVDLDLDLSPEMKLRIEGYKFREIADMLDTPEGTIRRRIHVERKRLREKV